MKKLLMFFFALAAATAAWAQGKCDFSTFNGGSLCTSYLDNENADGWKATKSQILQGYDVAGAQGYAPSVPIPHSMVIVLIRMLPSCCMVRSVNVAR